MREREEEEGEREEGEGMENNAMTLEKEPCMA